MLFKTARTSAVLCFPLNISLERTGKATGLMKDSSKRKRTKAELEEVKEEEKMLK